MSTLADVPITLVDIGSSGGIAPAWEAVANLTVVEFEPDERAPLRPLRSNVRRVVLRTPLWECAGEMDFHLAAKQQASSLFRPNQAIFDRYPSPERVEVQQSVRIQVDTLANQLDQAGIDRVDFIKLDAQGAELAILRGAEDLLRRCVIGLEIEVEFLPLYHGQPLFGEVDAYVRSLGFELFELRPTQWKYAEGFATKSRGQIAFADALYFRTFDSLDWSDADAARRLLAMIRIAQLHQRDDFAMHLVERGKGIGLVRQAA
ncbi:MAG TPA: FkbM family methyltransferase [Tepidisphaeraceae bacterium]|jgi:FkbM family methyltransferase|nr:FkbM family methyltransferase [Tepidisphaeraceae bacterium]